MTKPTASTANLELFNLWCIVLSYAFIGSLSLNHRININLLHSLWLNRKHTTQYKTNIYIHYCLDSQQTYNTETDNYTGAGWNAALRNAELTGPRCRIQLMISKCCSFFDRQRLSSSAAVIEQLSSRKFAQRIQATYVGSVCYYYHQTMVNYLSSRRRRYKNIQVGKKTCYTVMEFKRKQSVREIFPCGSCGTATGCNSIECGTCVRWIHR